MKKLTKWINKEWIVLIGVTLLSLFPLYMPGFFYTHDGIIHLFRTNGLYENLINGDLLNPIYYNVLNDFGYGWGIFYPPLSALIPAIFMFFGFSLFTAEKLFIIVASVFAAIFAFKLANELFKNRMVALLVAILYMLSPYKINQIFIRGAMGEVLLFTFLPLVFLGLHKIIEKDFKYIPCFIIGICGIVYSHVISSIYITLFGTIFLLCHGKKLFNKQVIISLIISCIIIILLCMPILIPLAQHQFSGEYRISEITTDVADRVVHPGQLIGGSFEGKQAENTSYYSNDKEMNYMIGLPFLVVVLLLPYAYKKIEDKKELWVYIALIIITILMMILPFIWNKFMILDVIQYPWRLLVFTTLFASIVSGYILKAILTKENEISFLTFIIGYSLLFVLMIGAKVSYAKTLNQDFNFENQQLVQGIDDYGSLSFGIGFAHEYLPKQSSEDYIIARGNNIIQVDGEVDILEQKFTQDHKLIAKVENKAEKSKIELPLLYYYGYKIFLGEEEISYEMSENGFIRHYTPKNRTI